MGFPSLTGKKALILGTGGTARTAYAVLSAMGADAVYRVSRTPSGDMISYADAAHLHADADVIFNATPVGMYPAITGTPIDLTRFPRLSCVFDAVYNPLRTTLVSDALSMGITAGGGLYMLVAQAFRAVELFLDTQLSPALLTSVYRKIEQQKENIVLIGMPSAGKTTIGRLLAERTGRTLIDLDEEIVKRAGCDIPTIFRERGETAFRDLESEVALSVSAMNGVIVATGGGAVLRAENVKCLKQNGTLCFLDRPLSALTPTADRPTASDREAIAARYCERYPIYSSAADRTFAVGEAFADTANAILKEFLL
jgi:shikimate dehydrogenase